MMLVIIVLIVVLITALKIDNFPQNNTGNNNSDSNSIKWVARQPTHKDPDLGHRVYTGFTRFGRVLPLSTWRRCAILPSTPSP